MAERVSVISTDRRFLEVSQLLAAYSMGDFSAKAELSPAYDDLDTIISGINMLGEELEERTISRDFMADVFRAVRDMLFILDKQGIITDCNQSSLYRLGKEEAQLTSRPISEFIGDGEKLNRAIAAVREAFELRPNEEVRSTFESSYKTPEGHRRFIECEVTPFMDNLSALNGFLLSARDITDKKNANQTFMRAMVQAVEKERSRVANDLHDSIGQELSGLKMMLEHLMSRGVQHDAIKPEERDMVIELIDTSIAGLRNTCYNLMPSTLESKGLRIALLELRNRMPKEIELNIIIDAALDKIPQALQVDIFRIVQEFISNSLKHAEADYLELFINEIESEAHLHLADNGKGFDQSELEDGGRGLYTMQSRVKTMNGEMELNSQIGEGTQLDIHFNLNTYEEHSITDRR